MMGAHARDWVDYGDTGIIRPVEEVLAELAPGLPGVEAVPHSFRTLPSTGITAADWCALGAEIAARGAEPGLSGIVVTHGTASMEETAFFTWLTCAAPLPVVFTGAQRPPNTEGSDAGPNLRAAIAAAASGRLAPGACLSMNATLFDARDVSKTANFALDAFEAPEFGPLGLVEADGTLRLARQAPPRPRRFALPADARALPRVDIAFSHAGADGAAIDAFIAAGARAIVSAGMPPGRCTPGERAALKRAVAAGVTVVQSSRAPRGRVPLQAYNTADGILSGGSLAPNKLRILLMLALAEAMPADALQALLLAC
ncbi:asparaginase (plasmid) [Paroceanicella profunda]|uniref:Asparaginase n=2 Tax=Paroceanicella profunda TaxID=2579971 RepID=A0A5B8G0Q2_9RHOB|nr:asparaginase [Paroceanicella profunda]